MEKDTVDTKSKILQVAIDVAGLKGEVTIREVTKKAGVNVAAINYYFGSKSNLMKEVEGYYSNLLLQNQERIIYNVDLPPQEKLVQWAKGLLEFMFQYPAIVQLIVSLTTSDRHYRPPLIEGIFYNQGVQDIIKGIIMEKIGDEDERLVDIKYLQFFSGVSGLVLNRIIADAFFEGHESVDIEGEEELDRYVRLLIDSLFG